MSAVGIEIKRRMAERGWRNEDLAFITSKSSGTVSAWITGRSRITATVALILAVVFRNEPMFWLDLRTQDDLAVHVSDEARMVAIRERAAAHMRGDTLPQRCSKCGQSLARTASSLEQGKKEG